MTAITAAAVAEVRQGLRLLEGICLASCFDTNVQIFLTLDKSVLAVVQWLRWRQGLRLREDFYLFSCFDTNVTFH